MLKIQQQHKNCLQSTIHLLGTCTFLKPKSPRYIRTLQSTNAYCQCLQTQRAKQFQWLYIIEIRAAYTIVTRVPILVNVHAKLKKNFKVIQEMQYYQAFTVIEPNNTGISITIKQPCKTETARKLWLWEISVSQQCSKHQTQKTRKAHLLPFYSNYEQMQSASFHIQ